MSKTVSSEPATKEKPEIRKGTSASNFWFGSVLVDINMIHHFDAKPKSRPWGHGHKIGQAIGNLRCYAERVHAEKPINEHGVKQIAEGIKVLRGYGYPV